jgi:CelD/BcsL family acetyltransferase involved in cellulose biosynthesis
MTKEDSSPGFGLRLRSRNTVPITREEYARHYQSWGGSFILHPEVLQFLKDVHGVETAYRGYFLDGACIGVVPAWGTRIAGDRQALQACGLTDRIDFGYPVLHLPVAPGHRCTVLYRAGFLLDLQRPQVGGAVFTGLKRMAILKKIPDELPTGKKEYQVKERRFERLGGSVRDIREFGHDEIVAMYGALHLARWQHQPHAIGTMKATLDHLGKFLFGKVLWLKDRAVAIQINYRADTSRTICIDYINGGVDKSFNGISPGSLLSYINGREACAEAQAGGRRLIYSYGKANTAYKDQWCNRVARGFTGFWLP